MQAAAAARERVAAPSAAFDHALPSHTSNSNGTESGAERKMWPPAATLCLRSCHSFHRGHAHACEGAHSVEKHERLGTAGHVSADHHRGGLAVANDSATGEGGGTSRWGRRPCAAP